MPDPEFKMRKASIPIREALAPWPCYAADEIAAVTRVLERGLGNYVYGQEGRDFESEFAAWCGAKFGLAVANGTVGLELALRGLGIGAGDEVIVTPRSFVASASMVLATGATPVFADVDRDSQNLTATTIERALTKKTRAVLPVHLAGWPCDMGAIMDLAARHGIAVIEDGAQAHGAAWRGRRVGSFGDAAVFSFCHDKIMSTGGEGGMVLVARKDARDRMDAWRRHGRKPGVDEQTEEKFRYRFVHDGPGSNYRLTEMQSAIGRVQLRKVDGWLAERDRNARRYAAGLRDIAGLRCPAPPPDARHAWYKYYVFVRPELLRVGWCRDRVLEEAWARGLPCFEGSCGELYREKVFAAASTTLPVARELAETGMMLPVHPGITQEQIDSICAGLQSLMAEAVK